MNQLAIDFDAARERREAGMASSIEHAETDVPGWGDHAFALMRHYACIKPEAWTCEEFRAWAYARGLPRPDEERAFGPVTQRAIRGGHIRRAGYASAASSNGSPKPTYLKVID